MHVGRRIFGPGRLRLIREELAGSVADTWREHEAELAHLRRSGRTSNAPFTDRHSLEEYEDPEHPVVALAKRRIEELTLGVPLSRNESRPLRRGGRSASTLTRLRRCSPGTDLRQVPADSEAQELAGLLNAFDVEVTYDTENRTLEFAATITAELVSPQETLQPPHRRSQNRDIAGAGFEPATSGL